MWSHDRPHDHPVSCQRKITQTKLTRGDTGGSMSTHTHRSPSFVPTNIRTIVCTFSLHASAHGPRGELSEVFFFFFPGRLCHRTANQRTAWEMSLCPRSCSCQGWGFIAVHFVALSKIGGTGTWPCEEKNLSVFFPPLKISSWNIYWTVSRLQSKTAGFKPTDVIQSVLKRFQWVFSQLTVQQLWNRME